MKVFKKCFLVLIVLGLSWRIIVYGITADIEWNKDNVDTAKTILAWDHNQPYAMQSLAQHFAEKKEFEKAENMARTSLWMNPTDSAALIILAKLWDAQGKKTITDKVMNLASELMPVYPVLRMMSADYWLEHSDFERAIQDWSIALQADLSLQAELFPRLLELAEDNNSRGLLKKSVLPFPKWWREFFIYGIQQAKTQDTVKTLYTLRKAAGKPLSRSEQSTYLERLVRDGLWFDAYIAWANGLTEMQLQELGNLFDGSFEWGKLTGGFDWFVPNTENAFVRIDQTNDTIGKRALHIIFRGREVRQPIIQQQLLLTQGKYRLHGRVRSDRVKSEQGLQWSLSCISQTLQPDLAMSERFLGSDDWREFSVNFRVPEKACPVQSLKLAVIGRQTDELKTEGELWFDDMGIDVIDDNNTRKPHRSVLSHVEGTVLLNQGRLYVKAQSGTVLQPKARLFALENSHGTVEGTDGSLVNLEQNSIMILN